VLSVFFYSIDRKMLRAESKELRAEGKGVLKLKVMAKQASLFAGFHVVFQFTRPRLRVLPWPAHSSIQALAV
jgi:hypothetical protein